MAGTVSETPDGAGTCESAQADGAPVVADVIVLAGASGRLAEVRGALSRNLFELPTSGGDSLLCDWIARFADLVAANGPTSVTVRLAIDRSAPEPRGLPTRRECPIVIERDVVEARGTAGVLRDVSRELVAGDSLLVIQASDLAWQWSDDEGRELLSGDGDVIVSADRDLRPTGMIRVRRNLITRIASVGFVDLKEQFLTRCALTADVRILRCPRVRTGTLHSRRSYLSLALPAAEGTKVPTRQIGDATPWSSARSCIEADASVSPDAVLLDSVVLGGARVDPGAVVIRSVVGPGVYVRRNAEIVDRFVVMSGPNNPTPRVVEW